MAADVKDLFTLVPAPGIQRDGTSLNSLAYVDGVWVRFYMGKPKKMGGYREIVKAQGPISLVHVTPRLALTTVYMYWTDGIQRVNVDLNSVGSGVDTSKTPVGFAANPNNLWSADNLYDSTGGGAGVIVAHAAPNAQYINSADNFPVYYGSDSDNLPLVTTGESVSGGCCVLQPYLFIYGNNGLIANSALNQPANFATGDANRVNVAGTKVVKGLPIRGGNTAPAGLFWSLESLIRVSYVGGTAKFRYDTVSSETSILGCNTPIEYDGVYYWIGVDRFYMYDGVVRELPNSSNLDWFFAHINFAWRNRCWASKVSRHGEIWWHFPKDNSTVCNWAIVYNVREKTWYDTPISRSAGAAAQSLPTPTWVDSNPAVEGGTTYSLWQHEIGHDVIIGDFQGAIDSYFETSEFGFTTGGTAQNPAGGKNFWTTLSRVEPDFKQSGVDAATEMTFQVIGLEYPNSPPDYREEYPFDRTTTKVDCREQQRLIRLRFRSNVVGGNYHMGRLTLHISFGDRRE